MPPGASGVPGSGMPRNVYARPACRWRMADRPDDSPLSPGHNRATINAIGYIMQVSVSAAQASHGRGRVRPGGFARFMRALVSGAGISAECRWQSLFVANPESWPRQRWFSRGASACVEPAAGERGNRRICSPRRKIGPGVMISSARFTFTAATNERENPV